MVHHGILKIGETLYLIKHILNDSYEPVASKWNEMDRLHKTFKRDGRMYFCEQVEEAITVDENVENPTI